MIESVAKAVATDYWLQAISIVVAVATAGYYLFRATILVGRSIWMKISPPLAKYAEGYVRQKRESFEKSSQDAIYFLAQVIRNMCLIFLFTVLYFIALLDNGRSAGQTEHWIHWLNEFAKFVFGAASTFNLGYLFGWVGRVADKRLRATEQ